MMVVWKFVIHTHLMNGSNCTLLVHGIVMSLPFAVNVLILRPSLRPLSLSLAYSSLIGVALSRVEVLCSHKIFKRRPGASPLCLRGAYA